MKPIVLQRETKGEAETREKKDKREERKLERLNSRRGESDKQGRYGSVFRPINLLDLQKAERKKR